MLAPRLRGALSLLSSFAIIAAVACGGGGSDVTGNGGGNNNNSTPASLVALSGNGQTGVIGTTLPSPLIVKVTTSAGVAVQNAVVNFAVTSGAASVAPTSATTDTAGLARTNVTLGSSAGNVVVTATVANTALSTTFTVTAGTTTQSTACSSGTAQTLAVGGVLPLSSGTGVCISGGSAGSQYALVAFYANPDSSQVTSVTVKSSGGAAAVSTADVSPNFNAALGRGSMVARPRVNNLQYAFDTRLRRMAQQRLARKVLAPHPRFTRSANAVTVPSNPTIGSFYTLNANGDDPCDTPINVTARVAAIGSSNIILADTANPSGGFTDAEYAAFATEFDTLINPLDVQNFGQPSDIDKNGKVLVLFTKEVNKLTPRNSAGVIDGFFFERDLFPTTDTQQLEGCPTSNVAEMFYVIVPDTAAKFSDARSKQDVLTGVPGTLAHEYQHLINAGRRLYVNSFQGFFEDVWLNEGLSHIAEELLYYKESGYAPRQNLGISQILATQHQDTVYENDQIENLVRYELFIEKPNLTTVYAGNDSLEVRGAIWNLLRYLADHQSTTNDATTWQALVNTESHGQQNLANVFGSNYMSKIRSWATSVYTDDLPGVTDATYLEPSWNHRSIFPHLQESGVPLNRYPLNVIPLSDTSPQTFSLFAGGEAYVRFAVPANGTVSIDWSSGGLPVNGLVQFTVVRSQ